MEANFLHNTVFLFVPLCPMVRNGLGQWLQRVIVTDKLFTGYYQTLDYAYWRRRGDIGELTPVAEMQIKAEIAKPAQGETVPVNSNVRVHGAAWTSDSEIAKVEVSTDGGSTWNEANLLGESKTSAWRFWEFDGNPQRAGKANARCSRNRLTWPDTTVRRDPDRGTYMINHLLPIEVEVK